LDEGHHSTAYPKNCTMTMMMTRSLPN